jgi:hypothetical protein
MMSKRERMIGLVAGGVLGLLALDQILLSPLLARLDAADLRVNEAQIGLADARKLFQGDLQGRRDWNTMAGESLKLDAPAAESQLLNAVRDWAQAAGLGLTSLKPERNEKEQGYQKLTIRATATGSMRQASRFLQSVQSADIPVRVSDIQIASRKEGTDDLTLNLGLSTIYLPPEPAQGAGGGAGTAGGGR